MHRKDIIRAAKKQGFVVQRTKKGHLQFIPPDKTKPIVVASGTPSDHRELQNLLSRLRRSGLKWP